MKLPRLFITVILFAACAALLAQAQSEEPNKCYTDWDFCNSGSEAENEYYWRLGWCASAIERGAVSASPSACMGQEEGTVTFPTSSKSSSPSGSSSSPSSSSSSSKSEPQSASASKPRSPDPTPTAPHENSPDTMPPTEWASIVEYKGVDGWAFLAVDADGNLLWPPVSVWPPSGCAVLSPYPELKCTQWR